MAFSFSIFGKEIFAAGTESRSTGYTQEHIRQVVSEIMGTKTSQAVNETTAVKLTSVYRAINLIADTVGILPFDVYKREGLSRVIDYAHPVEKLISRRPNNIMNSMQFRYTMTAIALLRGGAYARIIRDNRARPMELQVFADPYMVQPFTYKNELFYQIKDEDLPVHDRDMFRLLWTSFDGVTPVSPIKAASVAISKGLSAQQYGESIFASGGTRKIAIKTPGKLGEEATKNLRDSWINKHGTLNNAHKPAILEGGIDIVELGISPEDAQLIDTEMFTVDEISRLYGIPAHMLTSKTGSSYSNNEQQNIEFNTYTMNAWYGRWENEGEAKLLYESEQQSHFIKLDNNRLLRGDSKTRMDYNHKRFLTGSITPNEIRTNEGDNPIDNENANKSYVQAQVVPLEQAGAKYK